MGRALVVVLLLATACVGRLVTPGGETQLGGELSAKVEKQLGLVDDPALQSYVRQVGERLASSSPKVRDSLQYRCRVIDMDPPNAFALPGGYVYVSRGLLELLNSEDELANVLAHEIAHVSERHHLQHALRKTPLLPVKIATGVGAFAVGLVSPLLGRTVSAVGSAPELVLASYSRGQETSADEVGQEIAADSGWDPAAMTLVMESLAQEQELRGEDPEKSSYFSTHPTSPERARQTAAHAESFAVAEPNPVAPTRRAFLARLEGLAVGSPAHEGVIAGNEFLQPDLDFRLEFPSGWEIANERQLVRAVAENEDAIALLTIAANSDDPETVARKVIDKARVDVVEGPAPLQIGGLPAARAVARQRTRGQTFLYVMTWIAHGEHIYQIGAGGYDHAFEARRPALEAVAESFRPLRSDDWPRIREGRLRVAQAKGGESLSQLLPADSAWSAEEAAVANRLDPQASLPAGLWVKVARLERYVPKPE